MVSISLRITRCPFLMLLIVLLYHYDYPVFTIQYPILSLYIRVVKYNIRNFPVEWLVQFSHRSFRITIRTEN